MFPIPITDPDLLTLWIGFSVLVFILVSIYLVYIERAKLLAVHLKKPGLLQIGFEIAGAISLLLFLGQNPPDFVEWRDRFIVTYWTGVVLLPPLWCGIRFYPGTQGFFSRAAVFAASGVPMLGFALISLPMIELIQSVDRVEDSTTMYEGPSATEVALIFGIFAWPGFAVVTAVTGMLKSKLNPA